MLVRLSKVGSCPFRGTLSPADGFTGLEVAAVAGDVVHVAAKRIRWLSRPYRARTFSL
jgi:hypothetical protein